MFMFMGGSYRLSERSEDQIKWEAEQWEKQPKDLNGIFQGVFKFDTGLAWRLHKHSNAAIDARIIEALSK